MITAVDGLVDELRRVGIPVSVAEKIDAAQVLRHVALADRDAVKAALRCVLVKDEEHEPAYDAIFDIYFAAVLPSDGGDDGPTGPVSAKTDGGPDGTAAQRGGTGGQGPGGGLDSLDDAAIRRLLLQALDAEQWTLVRTVAGVLVDRHAGIQPGRAVAGTYYLFRTLRAVDPDQLLATLVERATPEDNLDGLTRRLVTEEYERRVRRFQQEVEAQIRRRLVADRGAEAVARTLRKPLPEDVDFLTASAQQIAELREVLAPMARRLTARLAAKRRHHRRGALDFRRTVRASMSTGAVPVTPVFRKPRPSKPELVILADISGSVSTFAAFTLQLTYALRAQFSKVRSFVFVDGVDEVTGILAEADNIVQATSRINAEGRGVWLDGRSDYGNALETFWERYGGQLRRRTAVLLLGDARTNYHASGATVVKRVAQQAGDVFWLNPEPATVWDSGDSVMREYAAYCDAVFECRNIRQLRAFIEHLA